jgi:uncharacterized iron-regulated membrane protein
MRYVCTLIHRWVGLTIAGFLIIAGLTGAVISWDHELDELLNSHLISAKVDGEPQSAFALKDLVEAGDPRRQVTYLPVVAEPGHTLSMYVEGRVDPNIGEPYNLGYNQVFVDPVSGQELGRREWGAVWPITTETFVSFLYKLHYTLHIPAMWGIEEWGAWLMGGVALLWTIDCFAGFYLTLPKKHAPSLNRPTVVERKLARSWWARWKPAWKIKTSGSAYRVNSDVHRALSLWTWCMLFLIAFTGFSLGLYRPVFLPLISLVSTVTPSPFELRTPQPRNEPIEPKLDFQKIADVARAEGKKRGWSTPIGGIGYARDIGVYRVSYFEPGEDHGVAGVGPAETYWDATDGSYLGNKLPWSGTAADIFIQAQLPIHSGRMLGLPGRVLVSLMGLAVATLSITGLLIWWRKRRARRLRAPRSAHKLPVNWVFGGTNTTNNSSTAAR